MDRGSSKHSPRVDDQMAGEVRGTVQGTAGARAEEWKMAEPSGEDQPQVSLVPEASHPCPSGRLGASTFPVMATILRRPVVAVMDLRRLGGGASDDLDVAASAVRRGASGGSNGWCTGRPGGCLNGIDLRGPAVS